MAEVVGIIASTLTIATLFKACVDAFDLVQTARHQEADYNRLLVKFSIEKCRLYTWGQMMGLTNTSQPNEPHPLDEFQFRDVVIQTLQTLHGLNDDSHKIQEHYGCREAPALARDGNDEVGLTPSFAAAFLHFQSGPNKGREQKLGQKIKWVIRDGKKFAGLVSHIKDLVDGLQEITKTIAPIILQQSAITRRITAVADAETLRSVSEACEEDYPLFSKAASLKSEVLSLPDSRRMEIEAWLADGTSLLDPDMTDLENMDLPKLKHNFFSLLQQRRQLEDNYKKVIHGARPEERHESITWNAILIIVDLVVMLCLPSILSPGSFIYGFLSTFQLQLNIQNGTDLSTYPLDSKVVPSMAFLVTTILSITSIMLVLRELLHPFWSSCQQGFGTFKLVVQVLTTKI